MQRLNSRFVQSICRVTLLCGKKNSDNAQDAHNSVPKMWIDPRRVKVNAPHEARYPGGRCVSCLVRCCFKGTDDPIEHLLSRRCLDEFHMDKNMPLRHLPSTELFQRLCRSCVALQHRPSMLMTVTRELRVNVNFVVPPRASYRCSRHSTLHPNLVLG
ncbi:hypothetical protein FA15DRAFT_373718 [Coprinopsis marcescibilis]|uniref:Uncharacterized protein n=1 Tax=Coprinopsis marcescibilis TaxID=230819 RepID=A0A5C3KYA4_COPMA|nr:hypothetical protein FA15DRAFT_373718 [Coprinopsis marcescibilis]